MFGGSKKERVGHQKAKPSILGGGSPPPFVFIKKTIHLRAQSSLGSRRPSPFEFFGTPCQLCEGREDGGREAIRYIQAEPRLPAKKRNPREVGWIPQIKARPIEPVSYCFTFGKMCQLGPAIERIFQAVCFTLSW